MMGNACVGIAPPPEGVRSAQRCLAKQRRELVLQRAKLDTEYKKTVTAVRAAHKRGDETSKRALAGELVRADRGKERLTLSIARVEQCQTRLRRVAASRRTAESMAQTTRVLVEVGRILDTAGTREIAQEYSRVMAVYNVRQEALDDALDSAIGGEDDDTLDAASSAALQQVLEPRVANRSGSSLRSNADAGSLAPPLLSTTTTSSSLRTTAEESLLAAPTAPVAEHEVDAVLKKVLPSAPRRRAGAVGAKKQHNACEMQELGVDGMWT